MDLEELLSQDFCAALEYRISQAWTQAGGPLRWYWCDGVLPPEISAGYSVTQLQQMKQLPARAWVGNTPNTKIFQTILKLGPQAVQAIEQPQLLPACIPSANSAAWLTLDPEHETLVVQLL